MLYLKGNIICNKEQPCDSQYRLRTIKFAKLSDSQYSQNYLPAVGIYFLF